MKKEETFWQKLKNDEQGWLLAGPLFFITIVGGILILYKMLY
jgi:hypothetical protein